MMPTATRTRSARSWLGAAVVVVAAVLSLASSPEHSPKLSAQVNTTEITVEEDDAIRWLRFDLDVDQAALDQVLDGEVIVSFAFCGIGADGRPAIGCPAWDDAANLPIVDVDLVGPDGARTTTVLREQGSTGYPSLNYRIENAFDPFSMRMAARETAPFPLKLQLEGSVSALLNLEGPVYEEDVERVESSSFTIEVHEVEGL